MTRVRDGPIMSLPSPSIEEIQAKRCLPPSLAESTLAESSANTDSNRLTRELSHLESAFTENWGGADGLRFAVLLGSLGDTGRKAAKALVMAAETGTFWTGTT